MILPLALVFYEDLIPGSQLVNRLQDLQYRVQPASSSAELLTHANSAGPMLIFVDLVARRSDILSTVKSVRNNPATAHIPIIGFADDVDVALQMAGREAGAALVVTDSVLLTHLPQFIERALQVE